MSDIKRQLNLPPLLKKKSFFLFGPRTTGKSFLIRQQFGARALILDLLQSQLYLRLAAQPWEREKSNHCKSQLKNIKMLNNY